MNAIGSDLSYNGLVEFMDKNELEFYTASLDDNGRIGYDGMGEARQLILESSGLSFEN